MPSHTPARYLAPAALAAAAVAVYIVGFGGRSDSGSKSGTPVTTQRSGTGTSTTKRRVAKPAPARTYTVQSGDVLSVIAQKTGVSVEQLQQLNPTVDAQSLRVGQKLKLAR
jgi:LysM repeat protein